MSFDDWEVTDAIAQDWETYSPIAREQIGELIELIDSYQGGHRLRDNPQAVDAWGVQAALGNWDHEAAMKAVRTYYAWSEIEPICWPEDGQPRPVLPVDITNIIRFGRALGEVTHDDA